jgi:hypothetical protein
MPKGGDDDMHSPLIEILGGVERLQGGPSEPGYLPHHQARAYENVSGLLLPKLDQCLHFGKVGITPTVRGCAA